VADLIEVYRASRPPHPTMLVQTRTVASQLAEATKSGSRISLESGRGRLATR
jgi:hypothetical protein